MQDQKSKSNNFFQCLGIFHRLFNFIASLTRGLKRVNSTRHHMRQGPTAVPILTTAVGPPNRAKVEFHRAQIYEAQISAHHEIGPVKKMQSVEEQERIREKKGKSVVTMISSEEEEDDQEELKLRKHPRPPLRQRQVRPLFDVVANINEKSDAFIRSRKEAMRRNYSFDMETC